ncbi:MAG: hypothetical protein FJ271_15780 [Planctomycetes bacterium]|nr:hypothetical protein [Planctomycetota bacterium]
MPMTLVASIDSACWRFSRRVDGWLVGTRPYESAAGHDRLAVHGDWNGPVKLVESGGIVEERAEFFSGGQRSGMDSFDEEAAGAGDRLLQELIELSSEPTSALDEWQPPAAAVLATWLAEAGHEPAIDKQQNVRLTIKRRGCDGQVRVERRPGRLRLTLPLGRWESLEPEVFQIMHRLTCFTNDRCRLARLAWMRDEKSQSCEAQVDLTGLPGVESLEPCMQQLWRDMLRLGVASLELVLRQLGVELPLLAEPRHRALAHLVVPFREGEAPAEPFGR